MGYDATNIPHERSWDTFLRSLWNAFWKRIGNERLVPHKVSNHQTKNTALYVSKMDSYLTLAMRTDPHLTANVTSVEIHCISRPLVTKNKDTWALPLLSPGQLERMLFPRRNFVLYIPVQSFISFAWPCRRATGWTFQIQLHLHL